MILLDTDICIEILRGNSQLIDQRSSYDDAVAVSFMTVAELFYGVCKSSNGAKNASVVQAFLTTVAVIESDYQIEMRFGELKANLSTRGITVADADLLIAATALERCTHLVTGNIRHFEMIPGLQIRDWRS
jgi:tRNA(fMet)-specific endonuclease VapC